MPKNYYENYQLSALIWSGVLHVIIFLAVIIGLPELWEDHRESLPTAMTVEIVSISDVTNIKKQESSKKDKKLKEEIEVAKKAVSASSSNQEKKEKQKKVVAPPKEKPKPKPEKKKEKPKEKPKKKEPKQQKKEEKKQPDLASILKSVEDAAKKEQGDQPAKANEDKKKAVSDSYNPSLPMSMTEIDAIQSQISRHWGVQAGARNAHELKVVLSVRLYPNGAVQSAELAKDQGRYYNDAFFRAAVDSAIRAVWKASPLRNLPPHKYDTWKYLEIHLDPRDVLY